MMAAAVFKIMNPASGAFAAVNYNAEKEKKDVGKLIYFENFGPLQDKENITKEEFTQYLKRYSARNKRIKRPSFHAMCSIKGRELSHEKLKEIALEVMKGLGYGENPILIYSHHDTNNNHVHIVSSRVGPDGRKINDSFEKKRANHILNAINERNPNQEFNLHLNNSLQYDFKTVAQFKLLMELGGYWTGKSKNGVIAFYKAGEKQGDIKESDVEEKIEQNQNSQNELRDREIRQIQALIYKYKKDYSSRLKSNREFKHTSEKLKFYSNLTDHLKETFGLEFVFFAGKEHDRPYGYTLIDHRNKKVYKGSEVFNMSRLLDNTTYEKESDKLLNSILDSQSEKPEERISAAADIDTSNKQSSLMSEKFEFASGGGGNEPNRRKKKKKKKNGLKR